MKRVGKVTLGALMVGFVGLAAAPVHAYVMPAGQLLGFMTANFRSFGTLRLTLSTSLFLHPEREKPHRLLEERLWLKPPLFYHREALGESADPAQAPAAAPDPQSWDRTFFRLLLPGSTPAARDFLLELGIDLERVAFTRLAGTIAYRLGRKPADSPCLLVEKERFLPLMLSYRIGTETVRVHYGDYQKLAAGWFPHQMTYSVDGQPVALFRVLDLALDTQMPTPVEPLIPEGRRPPRLVPDVSPEPPAAAFQPEASDLQEEELQEILEELKRRYQ